jgi:S-layer homology domain
MKKLLLLVMAFAMFVSVAPLSYATDVCSDTPHSSADFYVETSRASWLMSQSCTDSDVVTTMSQGSVMHVIGMTEYWHKLVTEDGEVGWMWVDFVQPTSKTFNPAGIDPVVEPDPDPIVEPEPVVYSPMYDISGYKYETAIWYVYNQGIVGGYPDGSYQANRVINRAELLKIIVEAAYDNEFESYGNASCFSDVPTGEWYTSYVCFAKSEGIVQGYADGSFKPAAEINFVEALKMAMVGFWHEYTTEGEPWYEIIVVTGADFNIIPVDIDSFFESFTRGQMADMITRILKREDGSFVEYLGEDFYANYKVTYETIDAGLDVEALVGSGKCITSEAIVYNNQESIAMTEYVSCLCNDGTWICERVADLEVMPEKTFLEYIEDVETGSLEPVYNDVPPYTEATFSSGGSFEGCTDYHNPECGFSFKVLIEDDWYDVLDVRRESYEFYIQVDWFDGTTYYGPYTDNVTAMYNDMTLTMDTHKRP